MNINFKVTKQSKEERIKAIIRLIFFVLNNEISDKYINILYEYIIVTGNNAKYYTFSRPARKAVYKIVKEKYNYSIDTKSMFPVLKKFKDINIVVTDEDNITYFTDKFMSLVKTINTEEPFTLNINFIIDGLK